MSSILSYPSIKGNLTLFDKNASIKMGPFSKDALSFKVIDNTTASINISSEVNMNNRTLLLNTNIYGNTTNIYANSSILLDAGDDGKITANNNIILNNRSNIQFYQDIRNESGNLIPHKNGSIEAYHTSTGKEFIDFYSKEYNFYNGVDSTEKVLTINSDGIIVKSLTSNSFIKATTFIESGTYIKSGSYVEANSGVKIKSGGLKSESGNFLISNGYLHMTEVMYDLIVFNLPFYPKNTKPIDNSIIANGDVISYNDIIAGGKLKTRKGIYNTSSIYNNGLIYSGDVYSFNYTYYDINNNNTTHPTIDSNQWRKINDGIADDSKGGLIYAQYNLAAGNNVIAVNGYLEGKKIIVGEPSYGTEDPPTGDGVREGQLYFKIINE